MGRSRVKAFQIERTVNANQKQRNREAASVAGAEWASGRVADEAREWALPREPQNRDGCRSHCNVISLEGFTVSV